MTSPTGFLLEKGVTLNHHTIHLIVVSMLRIMQLINKKFSLSKDYFRSSNQFCIIDINRDEIDELVTILDKELLICYQIGTTNNSSN